MKLLTSALALFAFASVASATPAVGDFVRFNGTWGPDTLQQTLTFTTYDAATQIFNVNVQTIVGVDAPLVQDQSVPFNDTASTEALQERITNCVAYGGTNETVTVPAGTYITCKFDHPNGGWVWLAVVPFGVVKWDTIVDSKTLKLELTAVTWGQP